jgi:uncharacterized integral membrane protein
VQKRLWYLENRTQKGVTILKKKNVVFLWILSIVFVLLIVQNTAPVMAHFLWMTANVPVILLLLFAVAVGGIAGVLIGFSIKKSGH